MDCPICTIIFFYRLSFRISFIIIVITAIILITSVVEGIYFIRLLLNLWYKEQDVPQVNFDFTLKYVVIVIALLLMVFGLYTAPVTDNGDNLTAINYIEGGNF